ncbi:hypothetical protein ACFVT2_14830 [Streptomyces sp. NPDC058000]|uniref:hypothetical protein n=1 Tax=Streptomyces sp. NPDC058000 TaxID=3346299 RepID=UPI0036E75503
MTPLVGIVLVPHRAEIALGVRSLASGMAAGMAGGGVTGAVVAAAVTAATGTAPPAVARATEEARNIGKF